MKNGMYKEELVNGVMTTVEVTDEEKFKDALDCLAGACEMLYEIDTDVGKACAFMANNVLKYTQAVYKDEDPLLLEI